MKTGMKIFHPDGTVDEQSVELPENPGYTHLRDLLTPLLKGGYLEHITVLHDGKRADMFVDEDGHQKRLPRNEAGTTIYRNNWLTQHPGTEPESIPYIVGTAVLFDRIVWS